MFEAREGAGGNAEYHLLPALKGEGDRFVDQPQAVAGRSQELFEPW
jgi:hypothetical protein